MKLIKDEASAWETYRVEEFPLWGIEKIDRGAWYVFRQWGGERIYLSNASGVSRARAVEVLRGAIGQHRSRIIVGIPA